MELLLIWAICFEVVLVYRIVHRLVRLTGERRKQVKRMTILKYPYELMRGHSSQYLSWR